MGPCGLSTGACTSQEFGGGVRIPFFNGNYPPCETDTDCPQYLQCGQYSGPCTSQAWHEEPTVGKCYCGFEGDGPPPPCYCETCSLDSTGATEVDAGFKLCFMADKYCNTDEDCGQPGLKCREKQNYCEVFGEGHLPCQTDEDFLFGWECVDNPPDMMAESCFPGGDVISEDSDAVSAGSADETNPLYVVNFRTDYPVPIESQTSPECRHHL